MIRCCGIEPVLKKFQSFEYWFCGECKKEVEESTRDGVYIAKADEIAIRTGFTVTVTGTAHAGQHQLEFDWFKQELDQLFKGDKNE